MSTRQYTARWSVVIDIEEPQDVKRQQRTSQENVLMLAMQAFLADQRVAGALKDALQGWAGDREIDRVLIAALDATHPDNNARG